MTQTERLLKYLRQGHKITTLEAIQELGILRLASRINELKHPKDGIGYDIRDRWKTGKAKFGGTYQIKEYWLHMVDETAVQGELL